MVDLLESLDYRILDLDNRALDRESFIEAATLQNIWEFIALPANDKTLAQQVCQILRETY